MDDRKPEALTSLARLYAAMKPLDVHHETLKKAQLGVLVMRPNVNRLESHLDGPLGG